MKLSNGVSIFAPVYWIYVYLPLGAVALFVAYQVITVRAELAMCRAYYQEMSTWDCYWAPKFMPQRGNR